MLLPKLTETEIKELSKTKPYGLQWARLNGDNRPGWYHQGRYVVNTAHRLKQLLAMSGNRNFNINTLLLDQAGKAINFGRLPGQNHAISNELLYHLVNNNQLLLSAQHINALAFQQAGTSSQGGFRISGHPSHHKSLSVQDLIRSGSGNKRRRDDDVISISSNDSDDGDGACNGKPPAAKKTKLDKPASRSGSVKSQTVLFKCHLCAAEILFSLETTEFIRSDEENCI